MLEQFIGIFLLVGLVLILVAFVPAFVRTRELSEKSGYEDKFSSALKVLRDVNREISSIREDRVDSRTVLRAQSRTSNSSARRADSRGRSPQKLAQPQAVSLRPVQARIAEFSSLPNSSSTVPRRKPAQFGQVPARADLRRPAPRQGVNPVRRKAAFIDSRPVIQTSPYRPAAVGAPSPANAQPRMHSSTPAAPRLSNFPQTPKYQTLSELSRQFDATEQMIEEFRQKNISRPARSVKSGSRPR